MNIVKSILAVLVIIGASVGATLLYANQAGLARTTAEKPNEPVPVILPDPIFLPLEPFTVTLRNSQTSRILYVAITLRLADQASSRQLSRYMPEVRNRVLSTLSEQSPQDVQTPDGRARLVQTLTRELQAPYQPEPLGPDVSSVLFTAFVVQ